MISNLFSGIGNAIQSAQPFIQNTLVPLANQYSQNRREQDILNVMDARHALPLINQQRELQIQQDEVNRRRQQQSALRELAKGGLDPANPVDYFRKAAAITGDTTALDRYLTQTIGGRPAPMRMADEYLAAQQSGDTARMNALEAFAKVFDKGVFTGGGQGIFGNAANIGSFNPNEVNPANIGVLAQGTGDGSAMPPALDMSALAQLSSPDMLSPQAAPIPNPAGVSAIPSGFGVPAGYSQAVSGLAADKAGAEERAKLQQQLDLKPQIKTAEKEAEYLQEGYQALPKQQRALQSALSKAQNITRVAESVRGLADKAFTTGFTGSIASAVAGTPAYDLKQNLNTLRANAAFDTLQEMRSNSPTGGALGAISEKELALLESAYTNLSNSQSKEQFLQNLQAFQDQNQRALQAMQDAYNQDYQRFGGQRDTVLPAPVQGNSTSARLRFNPTTGAFE